MKLECFWGWAFLFHFCLNLNYILCRQYFLVFCLMSCSLNRSDFLMNRRLPLLLKLPLTAATWYQCQTKHRLPGPTVASLTTGNLLQTAVRQLPACPFSHASDVTSRTSRLILGPSLSGGKSSKTITLVLCSMSSQWRSWMLVCLTSPWSTTFIGSSQSGSQLPASCMAWVSRQEIQREKYSKQGVTNFTDYFVTYYVLFWSYTALSQSWITCMVM